MNAYYLFVNGVFKWLRFVVSVVSGHLCQFLLPTTEKGCNTQQSEYRFISTTEHSKSFEPSGQRLIIILLDYILI